MPAYAVDKPLGPTSHDVVARARRALGTRRVGHGGTLDPLATGVLVVLSEEATKLSPFVTGSDKAYLARVAFGLSTPTLDAEGPVDRRAAAGHLTAAAVEAALAPFLELTMQRPPSYAAIKVGGVKGYEAARRGADLDLPERTCGYHRVELLGFATAGEVAAWTVGAWTAGAGTAGAGTAGASAAGGAAAGDATAWPAPLDADAPTAVVALVVRAGTYVRAFARDLGAALGVPAHLAGLRRERAGRIGLDRAVAIEDLATAAPLDPLELLGLPRWSLDDADARRVRDGQRLAAGFEGRAALIDPEGRLVAVADAEAGRVRVVRVWRDGV